MFGTRMLVLTLHLIPKCLLFLYCCSYLFHLCSQLIKLVEEPSVKSPLSNGDITTNGDTSAQSQDEDDTEWKVR